MKDNSLKALEIVKEVRQSDWDFQKKRILEKAVKEFKDEGLSNSEIQKLFENVLIKEQDNSRMISNNADYLELLSDILKS
tara:strand:+ start:695 stop:934 length:240 start_codon:yes stop_codon:yes gene_type:complete